MIFPISPGTRLAMVAFMRSAWLWLSVGIGLVTACGAPASAPGPVSSAASGLVSTSELDQLIEKVWAEHSVTPASEIDDARRVTLDLAGRVPTSSEASAFLADKSADKRSQAVELCSTARTMPFTSPATGNGRCSAPPAGWSFAGHRRAPIAPDFSATRRFGSSPSKNARPGLAATRFGRRRFEA